MNVYCGLDIGSLQAKGILLKGRSLLAKMMLPTGGNAPETAQKLFQALLAIGGVSPEEVQSIVATGYGRISVPFATKTVTEITCHARGIFHFLPQVQTLIDIGGQDSKAICLGKGKVKDFVMNDRCAAGTGRFLEVMAQNFQLSPKELGELSLQAKGEVAISATCTVFAESEVIGLIARGLPREEIARGIMSAIAQRVAGMVNRLGLKEPVAMSGGVAQNPGVVKALEKELGVNILIPPDPQMIGAWGAALIAQENE
jgi:predicted CoA-substrate-specific enzyme activase